MSLILFFTLSLAWGQEFRLAVLDSPPLSIHNGSSNDGISVKLARDLMKQSNLKFREIQIPPSRILEFANEKDVIYPFVTRSPDRESKLVWIGKIASDRYCFLSLKNTVQYNSVEDAKKSKGICAAAGGVNEKVLKDNGITNIDTASDVTGCTRKLLAGRVDATSSSDMVGKYLAIKLGAKPEDVHCGADLGQRVYWLAAGKSTPPETVEKLKAAFAEFEKSGKVGEYIKEYIK